MSTACSRLITAVILSINRHRWRVAVAISTSSRASPYTRKASRRLSAAGHLLSPRPGLPSLCSADSLPSPPSGPTQTLNPTPLKQNHPVLSLSCPCVPVSICGGRGGGR